MEVSQPGPYLAGMFAEMRCTVTVDDAIDTQISVMVQWQKDGRELVIGNRITALPANLVGGSRYDALLQFSTLSSSTDSGNYVCTSTVFPTESRNYIANTTESSNVSFSIAGNVSISYSTPFLVCRTKIIMHKYTEVIKAYTCT